MALTVLAGQIILADDLNKLVPVTAAKSAATSRSSSIAFVDDPHLALALPVGTFDVRGNLLLSSAANAAGDFNYRWAWTGTMTVTMGGVGPHLSLASGSQVDGEFTRNAPDATSPSVNFPFGVSTAGVNGSIAARVVVTAAGTLTLAWGQETSNASATTLESGSWVTAHPVA